MGVRSIYYGIRRVVGIVNQEFQRMAIHNKALATQMNRLSAGVDQQGSFAAMIAPLISAGTGIRIHYSEANTGVQCFGNVLRALAGKKTVMIAVGSTKKFAKGLGATAGMANKARKANERLKRSLGFDELEILDTSKQDSSPETGAGGVPGGSGFTPGTIYKEVATGIGDFSKIKKILKDIFDQIKDTKAWKMLAKSAKKAWGIIKESAINAWDRIKGLGILIVAGLPKVGAI